MSGLLVAIEGIDGAGKSTLARAIAEAITRGGRQVLLTREPTEFETGRVLRARLSGEHSGGVAEAAIDAEYFVADRIYHNARVIKPALTAGTHVVTDRYELGTLAYQSTQGLPLSYLLRKREDLHELGLIERPRLHVLVDVSVGTALQRIEGRGRAMDKFENRDFLERLRESYLGLSDRLPKDDVVVVDGDEQVKKVAVHALREIAARLPPLSNVWGELQ